MAKFSKLMNRTSPNRFGEEKSTNRMIINGWYYDSDFVQPFVDGYFKDNIPTLAYVWYHGMGLPKNVTWRKDGNGKMNLSASILTSGPLLGSNMYRDSRGVSYITYSQSTGTGTGLKITNAEGVETSTTSFDTQKNGDTYFIAEHPVSGVYVFFCPTDDQGGSSGGYQSTIKLVNTSGSLTSVSGAPTLYHGETIHILSDDPVRTIIGIYSPYNATNVGYNSGSGYTGVWQLNKANTSVTVLSTFATTWSNFYSMLSNPYIDSSGAKHSYFVRGTIANINEIRYVTYNPSTGVASANNVATFDSNPLASGWMGLSANGDGRMLTMCVKNEYLVAIPARRTYQSSWVDNSFCNAYSWKINSTNSLEYKFTNDMTDVRAVGYMSLNDDNTAILVCGEFKSAVYIWNDEYGFMKKHEYYDVESSMGLDSMNRLWYQDKEGLSVTSNDIPSDVSIIFEDDTLEYKGETVDKNIKVNVFNSVGDRLAVDLELAISTQIAKFGNSRKLTITTSADGDVIVPVTISGPGLFNISAKAI